MVDSQQVVDSAVVRRGRTVHKHSFYLEHLDRINFSFDNITLLIDHNIERLTFNLVTSCRSKHGFMVKP